MISDNLVERVISFARQGYKEIDFQTYDTDWDSEAYTSVAGQNSNNTVRVTDEFLKAVQEDDDWQLTWRGNGNIARTVRARDLWERCATPPGPAPIPASSSTPPSMTGTPARPAAKSAPPIRAGLLFLDDTACTLASLNLMAFRTARWRQCKRDLRH